MASVRTAKDCFTSGSEESIRGDFEVEGRLSLSLASVCVSNRRPRDLFITRYTGTPAIEIHRIERILRLPWACRGLALPTRPWETGLSVGTVSGAVKWLEERDLIWRDDANILRQVDPLMARYLKSL